MKYSMLAYKILYLLYLRIISIKIEKSRQIFFLKTIIRYQRAILQNRLTPFKTTSIWPRTALFNCLPVRCLFDETHHRSLITRAVFSSFTLSRKTRTFELRHFLLDANGRTAIVNPYPAHRGRNAVESHVPTPLGIGNRRSTATRVAGGSGTTVTDRRSRVENVLTSTGRCRPYRARCDRTGRAPVRWRWRTQNRRSRPSVIETRATGSAACVSNSRERSCALFCFRFIFSHRIPVVTATRPRAFIVQYPFDATPSLTLDPPCRRTGTDLVFPSAARFFRRKRLPSVFFFFTRRSFFSFFFFFCFSDRDFRTIPL